MNPLLRDELAAILSEAAVPRGMPVDLILEPVDVSPQARKMRAIMRIAQMHNWQSAITHFLETRGTAYLSDLTDPQLDDLLDRMNGYVDAAETGCSLAESLPAS